MPTKKDTPKDKVIGDISGGQIRALASILQSRQELAYGLGQTYPKTAGGYARDVYKALGYIQSPTYEHYYSAYQRQDIAKAIVNAPVDHSWRLKPVITENKAKKDKVEETKFEKAWLELVKEKHIYHYLTRADRLSGIGEYAVLLLGLDGNRRSGIFFRRLGLRQHPQSRVLFRPPFASMTQFRLLRTHHSITSSINQAGGCVDLPQDKEKLLNAVIGQKP